MNSRPSLRNYLKMQMRQRGKEAVLSDVLDSRFRGNDDLSASGSSEIVTKKLSQNPKETMAKEAVLSDVLDSRFRGNDDLSASGSFEIVTKRVFRVG